MDCWSSWTKPATVGAAVREVVLVRGDATVARKCKARTVTCVGDLGAPRRGKAEGRLKMVAGSRRSVELE